MERETRDQILQTLDEAAKALSGKSFDEGMVTVWAQISWLCNTLRPITTREQIACLLDKLDDPSPHELAFCIGVIRAVPHLLRDELRQRVTDAIKRLPEIPNGRPQTSAEQRQRICLYMLALYATGVPLQTAKGRAARKFGVSFRTVERAWSTRGQIAPDLEEIRKWLSESLAKFSFPSS